MAARPAPWLTRAYELLADGEWHDREPIVRAVVGLVPPGKAIRQAQQLRARQRTKNGNPGPADPRFTHPRDSATVGARDIVIRALSNAVIRGRLERRIVDSTPPRPPARSGRLRVSVAILGRSE